MNSLTSRPHSSVLTISPLRLPYQLHKNAGNNTLQNISCTAHLPPISQTIRVWWARHVGHFRTCKNKLIINVLLLLYNCGRIFFILSFFVGYILSLGLVWLRTIWLSARAGAHIEYSSHSRVEDVTITNVIIKTPDRKWDWSVNDFWWFLKKQ